METQHTGDPKPFGIIGLVIGIFSLLFSIIPCIGFYAIIPSIIAFIFCLVALILLQQRQESIGIPVSGLIISGLAIIISIFQYATFKSIFDAKDKVDDTINLIEDGFEEEMEEIMLEQLKEKIENELGLDSTQTDTVQYIPNDTIVTP